MQSTTSVNPAQLLQTVVALARPRPVRLAIPTPNGFEVIGGLTRGQSRNEELSDDEEERVHRGADTSARKPDHFIMLQPSPLGHCLLLQRAIVSGPQLTMREERRILFS